MKVFNPLYDTIFKYLMEDLEIARGLIALIIEQDVVEVTPLPQEQITFDITLKYNQLPLKRYDYVAAIRTRTAAGEELIEKVQIEVQRSYVVPELARFRSYIAEMYRHKSSVNGENGFLPIKTIYLLEKTFNPALPAVLFRCGTYKDVLAHTDFTGPRDELVELFNHDSWFIQFELLPPDIQSDLHRVLSVFAPWYRDKSNTRFVNLPDETLLSRKHALLDRIYRRLMTATSNDEIRLNLELEQEYNDFIEQNIEKTNSQLVQERKKRKAAEEQAKADRAEKELERKQRKAAEEQAKAAETKLINLVKKLHAKGFTMQEIAEDTGLSEGEINEILQ